MVAQTPEPPYYVVIFTSVRTKGDYGYAEMANRMVELARLQDGFLGMESARNEIGITVSYWRDLEAIRRWKENSQHRIAQNFGREIWYKSFNVRIAKVEKSYDFNAEY